MDTSMLIVGLELKGPNWGGGGAGMKLGGRVVWD